MAGEKRHRRPYGGKRHPQVVFLLLPRNDYTSGQDFSGATAVLDSLGEPDATACTLSGKRPPAGYVDLHYLRELAAGDVAAT